MMNTRASNLNTNQTIGSNPHYGVATPAPLRDRIRSLLKSGSFQANLAFPRREVAGAPP
jgi:hypothetical protein